MCVRPEHETKTTKLRQVPSAPSGHGPHAHTHPADTHPAAVVVADGGRASWAAWTVVCVTVSGASYASSPIACPPSSISPFACGFWRERLAGVPSAPRRQPEKKLCEKARVTDLPLRIRVRHSMLAASAHGFRRDQGSRQCLPSPSVAGSLRVRAVALDQRRAPSARYNALAGAFHLGICMYSTPVFTVQYM